jgi:hypothetical protein
MKKPRSPARRTWQNARETKMYKAMDGRTRRIKKNPSLGLIRCNPDYDPNDTTRGMFGVLLEFEPFTMSTVMDGLESFFAGIDIYWPDAFAFFFKYSLEPVREPMSCCWCNSVDRWRVEDKSGNYLGIACCHCGHIERRSLRRIPR